MKITDKYVFFWKEHPMCNFTKCVINYEGETFSSSEQLFMWMKAMYFKDKDTALKILASKTPEEARKLGRKVRNYDDAKWDKVRVEKMAAAVGAKFNQNANLMEQLCDERYQGRHFVEAAFYDRIWGIGFDEKDAVVRPESQWGRNELGKILDKIRDDNGRD